MSVESLTQSLSNLALAFGNRDYDKGAMVCVKYFILLQVLVLLKLLLLLQMLFHLQVFK